MENKKTPTKSVETTNPKTSAKLDKLLETVKTKKENKIQLSFKLDPALVKTMREVSAHTEVNMTAIVETILKDAFGVK